MTNWKTTLIGLAGGIFGLIANGVNWKTAVSSSLMALLGLAAKDHNVTGGTVKQPNE